MYYGALDIENVHYYEAEDGDEDYEVIPVMRFASQSITMKACLESIAQFYKKGILCYHRRCLYPPGSPQNTYLGEEDGTLKIVKDFVEKNPGYKIVYYPEVVVPLHEKSYQEGEIGYSEGELNPKNTLAAFNEYARIEALKIAETKNPYLMKLDADHIFDLESLKNNQEIINSFSNPLDLFIILKFNVHYCPFRDELYFLSTSAPGDFTYFLGEKHLFVNSYLANNKRYELLVIGYKKEGLEENLDTYYKELFAYQAPSCLEDILLGKNKMLNAKPKSFYIHEPKVERRMLVPTLHNSLHFTLMSRALDHYVRGYRGMIDFEYFEKQGFEFHSIKEMIADGRWDQLKKKYHFLNYDFYSYDNLMRLVRGFNYELIQPYLAYYRENPEEDFPDALAPPRRYEHWPSSLKDL